MKLGCDDVNLDRATVLPLGRRSAVTAPYASTEDKSPHLPPVRRVALCPCRRLREIAQATSRIDNPRRLEKLQLYEAPEQRLPARTTSAEYQGPDCL